MSNDKGTDWINEAMLLLLTLANRATVTKTLFKDLVDFVEQIQQASHLVNTEVLLAKLQYLSQTQYPISLQNWL